MHSQIKVERPCDNTYFVTNGPTTLGKGGWFWDHADSDKWFKFKSKLSAVKKALRYLISIETPITERPMCPFCDAEIVGENSNRCKNCNGRVRINRHLSYSVQALLWEEEINDEEVIY